MKRVLPLRHWIRLPRRDLRHEEVLPMEYRIRRALQGIVRHSYLKDERGRLLEKDIIDCSLGINPCGVTPKLTKDMYAATFDVLASYPAHPYVETRPWLSEYFSDVASLDVSRIKRMHERLGADALQGLSTSIFLEDGTRVLAPQPCFSSSAADARACGAEDRRRAPAGRG